MPCHPDRVRRQYEDRAYELPRRTLIPVNRTRAPFVPDDWQSHADNDAEQLARRGLTANVIEGDPLEPDDDHLWGV